MTGCVWSWCEVHMVRLGNGWHLMTIPHTGFCMKKLRDHCDGTDESCPDRKIPEKVVT
jgi:hypothetical protein